MSTAITTSSFPSAWKYVKIVPIPKSQTEFRPISLLPFLSNFFENILAAQIQPFTDISSMISEKHSGFRLTKKICHARSNAHKPPTIFMLAKVFVLLAE